LEISEPNGEKCSIYVEAEFLLTERVVIPVEDDNNEKKNWKLTADPGLFIFY
jgi:hypothetical protein